MTVKPKGRLTLGWANKEQSLLSNDDGTYEWVDPRDFRVSEVRLLHDVTTVGEVHSEHQRAQDNLLIRGDSLHALTSLLKLPEFRSEHEGKVKLVYIDPPFNTGQIFEHYDDGLDHSVWLSMLRDRLNQIFELLAPDGSVWVHLDDYEVHRARLVLDEVFSSLNFVTTIVWQKADSPRMDAMQFSSSHDYIHVYSKQIGWHPKRYQQEADNASAFPYVEEDGRRFNSSPLRKWGTSSARADRPTMWYPIVGPDGREYWPIRPDGSEGRWRWQKSKVAEKADLLHWIDKGSGMQPYVKTFAGQAKDSVPPTTWWANDVFGHNRSAKAHSKQLFGIRNAFDTPKPEQLLAEIIHLASEPGDVVLDCFGGSGTTAAVAHKMNRRWLLIELSAENVARFVVPRLSKVVEGTDPGGVTSREAEVIEGDLPEGMAPQVVKEAVRAFEALANHGTFVGLAGVDDEVMGTIAKAARAVARTKKVTEVLWTGGGGFRLLDVAPSVYTIDEGTVLLAESITASQLAESVAGQLGFTYEPNGIFTGSKGRMRLAVIDGVLGEDIVRFLVERLGDKERLTIVATAAEPGAEDLLRKLRPGSRARKVPRDLARLSASRSVVVQLVLDGLGGL